LRLRGTVVVVDLLTGSRAALTYEPGSPSGNVVFAVTFMIVHPGRDVKDPVGGGRDSRQGPVGGACRSRHSTHKPSPIPPLCDRTQQGQLPARRGSAPAVPLRRGPTSGFRTPPANCSGTRRGGPL